jgi:hypothetical protein
MGRRKHTYSGIPSDAPAIDRIKAAMLGDLAPHIDVFDELMGLYAIWKSDKEREAHLDSLNNALLEALLNQNHDFFSVVSKLIPIAKEQSAASPIDLAILTLAALQTGEIEPSKDEKQLTSRLFKEWPTTIANIHSALTKIGVKCDPATARDSVARLGIETIKGTAGRKKKK